MINDKKAEALEEKGLYRQAAARWTEIMALCTDDNDREWIKRRRDFCLGKVKRPPVKAEDFRDVYRAAKETQQKMGIDRPNGEAFRKYPKKKH